VGEIHPIAAPAFLKIELVPCPVFIHPIPALLNTPAQPLNIPQQLILLSSDPQAVVSLQELLQTAADNACQLRHVDNLDKLGFSDLERVCHAVLVDVRTDKCAAIDAIREIRSQRLRVALIALCRDFRDLLDFDKVTSEVDDYLVFGQFSVDELVVRIDSARRRRTRENTHLQEQSLLQSLLNNVSDYIFFKDRESRFTKVNRHMLESYGKGHGNLIGKTDFDIFSQEHAHAAYRDEQEIIRSGKAMEPKLEKETFEDGRINWVHTVKVPLKDIRGQIIGTMGIARDMTELKKTQDRLKSKQNMLRTIIDHALAGIFVKDRDGRYLLVNKQHVAYLGATTEADVLGKTLYDFIDNEKAERISTFDRKIMDSGKAIENLVDCREQGTSDEYWLLTNKVPLRDDAGQIVGLVGITLNITKQKQSEAELKKTIQLLEETKLQLIEAEKLKTVGRLAAGVAHEVKNPLNVISLGAEYLQSMVDGPEEILDLLKDMREAVNKANLVIFELLDYSSPQKLKMDLGDINELIRRVLGLMRHNFTQAGVSVIEDLSDSINAVRMDGQKMEQVFINIFLNAIKAMPEGGSLTVRSRMIRMQKTGTNLSSEMTALFRVGDPIVMIEVIDSGSGISPESAQKVFDPFFSTKASGEGSGLGLSVSKSIIDLHHGLISLSNREDAQGACMRLLLPAPPSNPTESIHSE
jgi:PAS domain S-box-containing protein